MAQDPKFLSVFDKKKNDDGVSLERLAQIVKDRDIEIVETHPKDNPKEKCILHVADDSSKQIVEDMIISMDLPPSVSKRICVEKVTVH